MRPVVELADAIAAQFPECTAAPAPPQAQAEEGAGAAPPEKQSSRRRLRKGKT